MQTTRERIRDRLAERPATPSALAAEFDITAGAALDHVEHVAASLEGESGPGLLVRPPACPDCGFDGFDDRLNVPSQCPECYCERVEEPAFAVE
jgi:predicted Zn-ribbon and HTH transcriptional regulator